MKPEELIEKEIYISKNSITVKDDQNKTRGVVRNISCMKSLQANKQFELSHKLKTEYGFTQAEIMNVIRMLFPYEGQIYFFASDGLIGREREVAKKMHKDYRSHSYENGVKDLEAKGITVIHCKEMHDSRKWD